MTVVNMPDNLMLFVGIIRKNKVSDIGGVFSFDDSTSCVWGSGCGGSYVWVNGNQPVEGEGGSWKSRENSVRGGTGGGSVWRKGEEAVHRAAGDELI